MTARLLAASVQIARSREGDNGQMSGPRSAVRVSNPGALIDAMEVIGDVCRGVCARPTKTESTKKRSA